MKTRGNKRNYKVLNEGTDAGDIKDDTPNNPPARTKTKKDLTKEPQTLKVSKEEYNLENYETLNQLIVNHSFSRFHQIHPMIQMI